MLSFAKNRKRLEQRSAPVGRGQAPQGWAIFLLALLFLFPTPAGAYEGAHYFWTYYLALHSGFTEPQAYQIASATYAVDFSYHTSPMDFGNKDRAVILRGRAGELRFRTKWRQIHAFSPLATLQSAWKGRINSEERRTLIDGERRVYRERLWEKTVDLGDPGPYLHFRQDSYPHYGWADLFGHGPAGHLPDYLGADPEGAWRMTLDTLADLRSFRAALCKQDRLQNCNDPVLPPDEARLREVLLRLTRVNRLPCEIPDYPEPLRDLQEFSLRYDPAAAGVRTAEQGAIYTGDALAALPLAGVERIFTSHGIGGGARKAMIEDPGPNQDRSIAVIQVAVNEDKKAGRLRPLSNHELLRYIAPDEERTVNPNAPTAFLKYHFNANGVHIGDPEMFRVESVTTQVGQPMAAYRSAGRGTGPDEVIEVTLTIPLEIAGMARGVTFMSKLPAVIVSNPEGRDADNDSSDAQTTVEALGNGSKDLTLTILRTAEELRSADMRWRGEVQVYGFPSVEFDRPLRYRSAVSTVWKLIEISGDGWVYAHPGHYTNIPPEDVGPDDVIAFPSQGSELRIIKVARGQDAEQVTMTVKDFLRTMGEEECFKTGAGKLSFVSTARPQIFDNLVVRDVKRLFLSQDEVDRAVAAFKSSHGGLTTAWKTSRQAQKIGYPRCDE